MVESAKKFFLKGHQVDFICWSDSTEIKDVKIIPTEPMEWPFPTLYRYSLFLREEELLKEYDFIFYIDADELFVSRVGEEILGDLVAVQHPMYALRKEYIPPYEPSEKSTAYIPRPGRVITENGKKRFEPLYFAGGLQGGRTQNFIAAMKAMKEMIDKDFTENNHIPIWNDESTLNAYFFKNPPTIVLSPSYCYPDSLIKAYYFRVWGRSYVPKIITLTKKFSLTTDGGINLQNILPNL